MNAIVVWLEAELLVVVEKDCAWYGSLEPGGEVEDGEEGDVVDGLNEE
jgi:hypothetical protein